MRRRDVSAEGKLKGVFEDFEKKIYLFSFSLQIFQPHSKDNNQFRFFDTLLLLYFRGWFRESSPRVGKFSLVLLGMVIWEIC